MTTVFLSISENSCCLSFDYLFTYDKRFVKVCTCSGTVIVQPQYFASWFSLIEHCTEHCTLLCFPQGWNVNPCVAVSQRCSLLWSVHVWTNTELSSFPQGDFWLGQLQSHPSGDGGRVQAGGQPLPVPWRWNREGNMLSQVQPTKI